MSRSYVLPTVTDVPADDQDAARRMIARRANDPADRAAIEEMLGLTPAGGAL